MLGKIIEVNDYKVKVKMTIDIKIQPSLNNLHVVFLEDDKKIIGEIVSIDEEILNITLVGEIIGDYYLPGVTKKPSFKANVRIINMDELVIMFGDSKPSYGMFYLGESSIYNNYGINVKTNNFFSNHFAILGNSGSGKSCALARIIQNLFYSNVPPLKSNFFIFDTYGEYHNSFAGLSKFNPNIGYKSITTNPYDNASEQLRIPLWLMGAEGIAMLLGANDANQLPIIEKTLAMLPILTRDDESVLVYKNNIIARCVRDIILTGKSASDIRNQIISVLSYYNTKDLNLDLKIVEPGYTRTLRQCLYVDGNNTMLSIDRVVSSISQFITDDITYQNSEPVAFSLEDFSKALSFALISEGILNSDKVYDYGNILAVRTNFLLESESRNYFDCKEYITQEQYIKRLMTTSDGKKAQVVNFNINYIDDKFAKVIVKVITKLIFNQSVTSANRAGFVYHIIIEEAHRYVQNDTDNDLFSYNIFDRIAKEGRKYGVLLGFVTQRPSEISETALSQCSNFLVFRTYNGRDLDYLEAMMPNTDKDVMNSIKVLQPGICITLGSAFKISTSVRLPMPNPAPLSSNAKIDQVWY